MAESRLEHLLARELDGTLTPLEAEELERLALTDPQKRRERAGWRRVRAALAEPHGLSDDFDPARLTRAIMNAQAERTSASPGPWVRLLERASVSLRLDRRWLFAGSTALVVALFFVVEREPSAIHGSSRPDATQAVEAHEPPAAPRPAVKRAPVDVALEEHGAEEGAVEIRF